MHKHDWAADAYVDKFKLFCIYPDCDAELEMEEIEAILNEHEAVKDVIEAAEKVMYSLKQRAFDWPLINELEEALARLERKK